MSVQWLEQLFEENEVLSMVREMVRDKALGIDNFTMTFSRTIWYR